jgi:hypothetical protein
MREYVRGMTMYQTPNLHLNNFTAYGSHPGVGAGLPQSLGFHAQPNNYNAFAHGQVPFTTNMDASVNSYNYQPSGMDPWQHATAQPGVNSYWTSEPHLFTALDEPQSSLQEIKTEDIAVNGATGSADSPESDGIVLSPSLFFAQEVVLPGCCDPEGICRCGPDCECDGCVIHSRKQGVSGHAPSSADRSHHGDIPSEAPTTADANLLSTGYLDMTFFSV